MYVCMYVCICMYITYIATSHPAIYTDRRMKTRLCRAASRFGTPGKYKDGMGFTVTSATSPIRAQLKAIETPNPKPFRNPRVSVTQPSFAHEGTGCFQSVAPSAASNFRFTSSVGRQSLQDSGTELLRVVDDNYLPTHARISRKTALRKGAYGMIRDDSTRRNSSPMMLCLRE